VVLRRVVAADGRSRAYVNGQAMSVQSLRRLGEALVDVHGQMEYQSLVRSGTQRELLDGSGDYGNLLEAVRDAWREVARLREEHAGVQASVSDRDTRLDMLRYHLSELRVLELKPSETENLLGERQRLAQRGRLGKGAREIVQLLREADDLSAEHAIARALTIARALVEFDAKYAEIARAIEESLIALREGVEAVERYESTLDADPARQEWVEQRLAAIEAVARKHRIEPTNLLELQEKLALEFDQLEKLEASIEQVKNALDAAESRFATTSQKLSAARCSAAQKLSERITTLMQTLGMPGGRFEVAVRPSSSPAAHGSDEIEFLVSANPGQPPRALSKVASGGELSRISLAVQVAAVQDDTIPCLVFDEVDAGVGGGVAEIVGRQLRALGERAQVLCVTHLPQVASQAHAHVRVAKLSDGKTTRTSLTTLTADERIEEIARMLGGIDVTAKAREHAAEMLRAPVIPKKRRRAADA
jgi:DNA repair protein RecN (Recombination protein N)